jgi:hypothetical protein
MTIQLHFELFLKEMRLRAGAGEPKQLLLQGLQADGGEDVGAVRLSRLEAAMREARAARVEE